MQDDHQTTCETAREAKRFLELASQPCLDCIDGADFNARYGCGAAEALGWEPCCIHLFDNNYLLDGSASLLDSYLEQER